MVNQSNDINNIKDVLETAGDFVPHSLGCVVPIIVELLLPLAATTHLNFKELCIISISLLLRHSRLVLHWAWLLTVSTAQAGHSQVDTYVKWTALLSDSATVYFRYTRVKSNGNCL
eukprot:jgi/Botrbrau1/21510/Bobra.174_2s0016.1